jgi:GTPase
MNIDGENAQSDLPQVVERERPIVAIVGRPNVGKSTLFNRLLGARWAITDDLSGVTRDRIFAPAEWSGRRFTLVDTGGYVLSSDDAIETAIREQVETAIGEADVVVLVCDVQIGLTDLDRQVAEILRRQPHPKLLIANKADTATTVGKIDEFYSLGLGDPFPVSAATGRDIGALSR